MQVPRSNCSAGLFMGPCLDRGIVSIPAAAHTRGLQRKHDAWSACRKFFSVIGALSLRKPFLFERIQRSGQNRAWPRRVDYRTPGRIVTIFPERKLKTNVKFPLASFRSISFQKALNVAY